MGTVRSKHSLRSQNPHTTLLKPPEPPYIAVISTNIHHGKALAEYTRLFEETLKIANTLSGYLGMESSDEISEDGTIYSISVFYFKNYEALEAWQNHPDHLKVKANARTTWYKEHNIRICEVKKQYGSSLS